MCKTSKFLSTGCFIFMLFIIACRCLSDSLLWYDEAVQFWICKGIYPYGNPLTLEGNISDVLFYNQHYNKDPGGFSILLHFWTFIFGNHPYVLRIVPFLFYSVSFVFLFKLLKQLVDNDAIQKVILFVIAYIFIGISSEFRAYSMELCGVVCAIYLWLRYKETDELYHLVLLSLSMSFFCTSRYCYIVFAGILTFRVLWYLIYRQLYKRNIIRGIIFGLPLLLTVIFIYVYQMRIQSAESSAVTYLPYLYSSPLQLFKGILSYLTLSSIFIFIYNYCKNEVNEVNIITFCCVIVYILLSFANLFPWDAQRTLSLYLICTINVLIFVFKIISNKLSNCNKINYSFTFVAMLITVFVCVKSIGIRHFPDHDYFKEFEKIYSSTSGSVYIDRWMSPTIRYAYVYGNLKNYKGFTDRVILAKDVRHDQPIMEPGIIKSHHTNFECDFYLLSEEKPSEENFLLYEGYKTIWVKK